MCIVFVLMIFLPVIDTIFTGVIMKYTRIKFGYAFSILTLIQLITMTLLLVYCLK